MYLIDVKLIKTVFIVFLICVYTVEAHLSYYRNVVLDDYNLSSEQNEVFTECVSPCPKTCANLITNTPCELTTCLPGFDCKHGFYRDDSGNCVSAKKCKCQDPNAVLMKNVNTCPGGTCTNHFFEHCHKPRLPYGCQCRKGYVKDNEGLCVHKESCCPAALQIHRLCGPVTECEPTCNNPNPKPSVCTIVKLFTCAAGCFCKNGYIKDSNGNCILQTACSCGAKEEYSPCGPTTEATCAARIANSDHFGGGCYCLPGFIRDTTGGSCIPVAQCPCGLDEISTLYGPTVQATCDTRISSTDYNGIGCYCRPGFIRLSVGGACVAYDNCPCGNNEEYNLHGPSLQATCDNRISSNDDTGGGCYCTPGHIRSTNALTMGQCILITQCACGSNEEYKLHGPSVEATCSTRISSNDDSSGGCYCAPGYIRSTNVLTMGQCILIDQCACGPNEEYKLHGPSVQATCDNKFSSDDYSSGGCYCAPGYIRSTNALTVGQCILIDQCACGSHEEYKLHGPSVEATCDNKYSSNDYSGGGCYCIPGYIRSTNVLTLGQCIVIAQCACGSNEEYKLHGPSIEATCINKFSSDDYNSGGCYCAPGYIRSTNALTMGHCIFIDQCACNSNEEYKLHGPSIQATCSTRISSNDYSSGGCYCAPGYIRSTNVLTMGQCILINQCACNSNEEYKLHGPSIQATCNTRISSNDDSSGGCYCIPGYIRSTNVLTIGQCILIDQCACNANEEYKLQGPTTQATCLTRISSDDYSSGGCYCRAGYIRSTNALTFDQCIVINQCACGGSNQEYKLHGPSVQATCDSRISSDDDSSGGCYCTPGHIRSTNLATLGQCIAYDECLCSGSNEEYKLHGPSVEATCLTRISSNDDLGGGCFCTPGHIRSTNPLTLNECIAYDECLCSGSNEEYKLHGPSVEATCLTRISGNDDLGGGCFCTPGHIRSTNPLTLNECIAYDECLCSGSNEEYKLHGPSVEATCLTRISSNDDLGGGCFCTPGHIRSTNPLTLNECIAYDECLCSGSNEEYKLHGPSVEATCLTRISSNDDLGGGCFCTPGHIRSTNPLTLNECIAYDECLCSGSNEEYKLHGPSVEATCLTRISSNDDLGGGCFCTPGHIRSTNPLTLNECIAYDECLCSGSNEEYKLHGPSVEATCLTRISSNDDLGGGCFCTPGHIRSTNPLTLNECIAYDECLCSGSNEEYKLHGPSVEATCLTRISSNDDLGGGCFCTPGHIRSTNPLTLNECIAYDECLCSGSNEEYKLHGPSVEATCLTRISSNDDLGGGCFCTPGHIRSTNPLTLNECIAYDECLCSGSNEEYKLHGPSVEATCLTRISSNDDLGGGCFCTPGHIRSTNPLTLNECIAYDECLCSGSNEEYKLHGPSVEATCLTRISSNDDLGGGCFCTPGHIRSTNPLTLNECIAYDECLCSGSNEEYKLHGPSVEATCLTRISSNDDLGGGCFCTPGHIRSTNPLTLNECIAYDECLCSGSNEEYKLHGPSVEATCLTRISSNDDLGGGCFCTPGHIRSTNPLTLNECIAYDECLCSGSNEEYKLHGPSVEATCLTRISSNDDLGGGCFCTPGHIRSTNPLTLNECIAYDECLCSGSNEEYKLHGPSVEATCLTRISSNDDLGGGCFCTPGHIRSTNPLTLNECIAYYECHCDTNEQYSLTGPSIEATCAAPFSSNDNTGSNCFCKPNYIRVETGSNCIPISDCPCDLYPGLASEVEFTLEAPMCPSYCISNNLYSGMCNSLMKMPGCICKNGKVFEYEEVVGVAGKFLALKGCRDDCV